MVKGLNLNGQSNLRAWGLPPKKLPKRPCKTKQWHNFQYHWTCYQSLWNDVELVTIRWFPSHHILHPANILENYPSMSSLPHFCRKKSTATKQRSVLLAVPSNPQSPHPPPPSKERGTTFTHQPLPNHSHHQHPRDLCLSTICLANQAFHHSLWPPLWHVAVALGGFLAPEIKSRFDRGLGRGKGLM